MDKYDERVKLDLFPFQSTYRDDYKVLPFPERISKGCSQDLSTEKVIKSKEYTFQDHETYGYWRKNIHIPFDLLLRPKEVIQKNPHEPFEIPVLPKSVDEEIVKTRPRVYMSPAVSMDDIEDKKVRKILCDFMYTSETTKAIQESAVHSASRDVPNTTVERGDPVKLQVDVLPPLPKQFRQNGKEWETKQLKLTVDPTKTFWEYKDPPVKCGACHDPVQGLVPEATQQELKKLLREDRLRLPHDIPIPGYAGYRPMFSGVVPLAKSDMPVVHPLLSISQAIGKRQTIKEDTCFIDAQNTSMQKTI